MDGSVLGVEGHGGRRPGCARDSAGVAGSYARPGSGESSMGGTRLARGAPAQVDHSSVAALYSSVAFQRHVVENGVDVRRCDRRLELFRALRELDPDTFQQLWATARGGIRNMRKFDSAPPPVWVLAFEFICTTGLYVAALAYLLLGCLGGGAWLPLSAQEVEQLMQGAAAWAFINIAAVWWSGATLPALVVGGAVWPPTGSSSAAGSQVMLRYEHDLWLTPSSTWRLLAATGTDILYSLSTLGLGLVVCLAMRCYGSSAQTVGERLMSVRLIREWNEPLAPPQDVEGGNG